MGTMSIAVVEAMAVGGNIAAIMATVMEDQDTAVEEDTVVVDTAVAMMDTVMEDQDTAVEEDTAVVVIVMAVAMVAIAVEEDTAVAIETSIEFLMLLDQFWVLWVKGDNFRKYLLYIHHKMQFNSFHCNKDKKIMI